MMESAKPLVSVVIPTRNRPHLVTRAVRSALVQTLDAIFTPLDMALGFGTSKGYLRMPSGSMVEVENLSPRISGRPD